MPANPSLSNLFLCFLKLGATAFGGPAMVPFIGQMAVEQRKWLNGGTFRDGVALCQMIPGATAMQVSAYVGFQSKRSGWRGSELYRLRPSCVSSHGWSFSFLRSFTYTSTSGCGVWRPSNYSRSHCRECGPILWQNFPEKPARWNNRSDRGNDVCFEGEPRSGNHPGCASRTCALQKNCPAEFGE